MFTPNFENKVNLEISSSSEEDGGKKSATTPFVCTF